MERLVRQTLVSTIYGGTSGDPAQHHRQDAGTLKPESTIRQQVGSVARAARERPSFALYLAALALFPFQALAVLLRAGRRPTDVAIWSGLAGLGVDGLGQDIEHFRHVWILLGIADADRREGEGAESSSQRASRREGS